MATKIGKVGPVQQPAAALKKKKKSDAVAKAAQAAIPSQPAPPAKSLTTKKIVKKKTPTNHPIVLPGGKPNPKKPVRSLSVSAAGVSRNILKPIPVPAAPAKKVKAKKRTSITGTDAKIQKLVPLEAGSKFVVPEGAPSLLRPVTAPPVARRSSSVAPSTPARPPTTPSLDRRSSLTKPAASTARPSKTPSLERRPSLTKPAASTARPSAAAPPVAKRPSLTRAATAQPLRTTARERTIKPLDVRPIKDATASLQAAAGKVRAAVKISETVHNQLSGNLEEDALQGLQGPARRMVQDLLAGRETGPFLRPSPESTTVTASAAEADVEEDPQVQRMRSFVADTEGRSPSPPMLALDILKDPQEPPPIPESADILSVKKVMEKFLGRNTLPSGPMLKERGYCNYAEEEGQQLRGINFRGKVLNDDLRSAIDEFLGMEVVCIYNSPDLSEITALRYLKNLKVLFLGKLPQITPKAMERLFPPKQEVWQQLQELHLAGMPVTDDFLRFVAQLPNLRKINISSCSRVTRKGLLYLQKSPKLVELSIERCPFIDIFSIDEFRNAHPKIRLHASVADPKILGLALEEAEKRMKDAQILKQRLFHSQRADTADFYQDCCTIIGYNLPARADLDFVDQMLQSYIAIARTAGAIFTEWLQVGFFIAASDPPLPNSVSDVVALMLNRSTEELDLAKILRLDFAGLEIHFFPEYIARKEQWPKLKTIHLQGTFINDERGLPKGFRKKCPKLELIEFPDGSRERLA